MLALTITEATLVAMIAAIGGIAATFIQSRAQARKGAVQVDDFRGEVRQHLREIDRRLERIEGHENGRPVTPGGG